MTVLLAWVLPMWIIGFLPETKKEDNDPPLQASRKIPVVVSTGETVIMELEEYVCRAVAGEMPASFAQEALKAQAVLCRTYAYKRVLDADKHPEGAVCTDSSCCQAFSDALPAENVQQAVLDTAGQVLMYDNALIEATYFSCSGGMTEDAAAVWGTDVPYLQAVESPGEEGSRHYVTTVHFTKEQLAQALQLDVLQMQGNYIAKTTYTDGGGIASVTIGGKRFTGVELRKLLSLKSTSITITPVGDGVMITTKGYGHRVGMSQYGADAMGVAGCDYREILQHYYKGVQITVFDKTLPFL